MFPVVFHVGFNAIDIDLVRIGTRVLLSSLDVSIVPIIHIVVRILGILFRLRILPVNENSIHDVRVFGMGEKIILAALKMDDV